MKPLLKIENLEVSFSSGTKETKVLDQISFEVKKGETLCIVGESGSGKSVTLLCAMGLLASNGKITKGTIELAGESLLTKSEKEMDEIRGNQISMIFQDAMTSLNPLFKIGNQMIEGICAHTDVKKEEAKKIAIELLAKVGLPNPKQLMKKYPHTLSGGMRQRVMIAMALCCKPHILLADEPTTALDVTIQAQIMQGLKLLKKELGMSILLVTHDMGLVAEMADRVIVMYAGQIVEEAGVYELFENPSHPYTKALLQSIPTIHDEEDKRLVAIEGVVPEEYGQMIGCRFKKRCPFSVSQCEKSQPLIEIAKGHKKRCFRMDLGKDEGDAE
jgi:peptide/nickel transport system ATP-binding protein